jgi:hypothetical protein
MEKCKMKRPKIIFFITGILILFLLPLSCGRKITQKMPEKKIEYRNMQMIEEFSPQSFLPQNSTLASIQGKKQSWVVGDFDGDSLGEILFAYHFTNTSPENPSMGAIFLKQEEGKWIKKYEYRETAINLYMAEAYDITGDGRADLILGWETNSNLHEKHIYLYRWNKKDLESLGNFTCSKLIVDDLNGIYGLDNQYELGIWTETETSLSTDIFRWNAYNSLPVLFSDDYGKPYTQQKLSRAEDLEVVYFKDYVIPELLLLEKTYPNEAKYDFTLIQAYLNAQLPNEVLRKIDSSEGTLYQADYEKIPYIKAQVYFLKEEIAPGNQILQKELSKPINRVDAGTTLELLGKAYAKAKDWDKAMLAYNNAKKFHIPITETYAYDGENQFQLSLAKDKARLEVLKHFYDLRDKASDPSYKNYFQNDLQSDNKNKTLPTVNISEFYLSLNEYNEPYATVIFWEEKGKKKEIVLFSIDEDQHKIKFNYAPAGITTEKTKSGWKMLLTFQEKNSFSSSQAPKHFQKIIFIEENKWKLVNVPE